MKKYKHIATGDIAIQRSFTSPTTLYDSGLFGSIHPKLIENSKDWEEIKGLTFEIQSFKGGHGHVWSLLYDGKYQQGNNTPSTLEWMLSLYRASGLTKFRIWSVKRLSDNIIFTVNERTSGGTIKEFRIIENNRIIVHFHEEFKLPCYLDAVNPIQKIQKLFTTEDKVDIYVDDTYAYINNNIVYEKKAYAGTYAALPNFYWSTREKALEYQKTQILFTTEDGIWIFKDRKIAVFVVSKQYNFSMAEYVIDNIVYYYLPDRNWYFHSKEKALAFIESQKPKIYFTTEDNVQISKTYANKVWYIGEKFKLNPCIEVSNWSESDLKDAIAEIEKGYKYFANEEKAKEYVLYNKPCLSLNDVATVYVTANRKAQPMIVHGKKVMKMGKQPEALLNLVKQKLK